jgi:hypothetical protein
MEAWWSYTVSDFLLFSPRTYHRLIAQYNDDLWPAQLVALAAGVGILLLSRSGSAQATRAIHLVVATGWAWVAWGFHLQRYATINWAAVTFAAAFALEALLLVTAAVAAPPRLTASRRPAAIAGVGIFVFALAAYPLIAKLGGRNWNEAELFGLHPDPTALGTLGLLILAGRAGIPAAVIPALWLVIAALTLYGLAQA